VSRVWKDFGKEGPSFDQLSERTDEGNGLSVCFYSSFLVAHGSLEFCLFRHLNVVQVAVKEVVVSRVRKATRTRCTKFHLQ
jgi:hypothetical protein